MFLTTAEFLPQHREHHRQTLQIISTAEASGQARLAEMNRQFATNLEKIITALGNSDPGTRGRPVRADNTAPIIAAARHRHQLTRAKAIRALRELSRAATPVTFDTVARTVRLPVLAVFAGRHPRRDRAPARRHPRRTRAPGPSEPALLQRLPAHPPANGAQAQPQARRGEQAAAPAARPSPRRPASPLARADRSAARSPFDNNPVLPAEASQATAAASQTLFTTQPPRSEQ